MRARAARRSVVLLTAALLMLQATGARADRQMDPELRGVLAEVIAPAGCFDDKYDRALWFASMGPRLARYVKNESEREQILHHVHCESRRVNIPPDLVLAVMDVESRFDRYAVSSAGAVGLMQVMPFWPSQLGMSNEQLIRVADNVRMGTTILGYYLRKERGNYARALQRYNGSLGRPDYSDKVIDRLASRWRYSQ
jgi:soluble lytic murein transglycosylase-like protein